MASSSHTAPPRATIDKLDYRPRRPSSDPSSDDDPDPSSLLHGPHSFLDLVADGIAAQSRAAASRRLLRNASFAWAVVECLCANSISAFSLYAPLLARRLGYSQLRVNGVAIAAELGMYLPVPLSGYLCDRYGPRIPSVLSGVLFGVGYLLAAGAYRSGPPRDVGGEGWPFGVMALAFVLVGVATSMMYLAAVSPCAKNFGRGRYKGLALAVPIAAFGLSGMWQSQIGANLLAEEGGKVVDVYRYFVFLGVLLLVVGLIGGVALVVVDEEELIDEAVEELERSGLLDDSALFHRAERERGYGTLDDEADEDDAKSHALLEQEKKTWLLNEETRLFLQDKTMWLLALGFFLITGPGEAFVNNLGTIIEALYPPGTADADKTTDAATHVSIIAIASTLARILTASVADLVAPVAAPHQHRRGPSSLSNSLASLGPSPPPARFSLSRMSFLIAFCLLLSAGQVLLASGAVQGQPARLFWLVSALVGAGYGAVFSLVPIVISIVWGVENFATNWGVVAVVPAAGATVWGLAFAGVYQHAADAGVGPLQVADEVLCHGTACYAPTFWAMAASVWVACLMWFWAWRGAGGWKQRGVLV